MHVFLETKAILVLFIAMGRIYGFLEGVQEILENSGHPRNFGTPVEVSKSNFRGF